MITLRIRRFCMTGFLAVILLFVPSNLAFTADVLYVAPLENCGGRQQCFSTIQDAVNAARSGDEIRVAAGVYSGVNNAGGHTQHLYIDKNLTIRGGFTTSNWDNPNPTANLTELQAQTLGRVLYIDEGVSLRMDGFSLNYGNSTGQAPNSGGGIFAEKADLTLSRCQVLHNSTAKSGSGGGLYARESIVNINSVRFEDNYSDNGGGAFLLESTLVISNSEFIANKVFSANATGQAITVEEGSVSFIDNQVDLNETPIGSTTDGSVYFNNSSFIMQNNHITGTMGGGGYGSGVSLRFSEGYMTRNYIANHNNKGVSIYGGFVTMNGNEVTGNTGRSPQGGSGVTYSPPALEADSHFVLNGNYIHHNIDNYGTTAGGGLNLGSGTNSPVFVVNNIIQDNISAGGAILSQDGNGGGVWISGDNIILQGNIIQRNIANGLIVANNQMGGCGGGVYIAGNAVLVNNIITDNKARFAGSGVYVIGSSPFLYHNTIANNIFSSSEDGSGVFSAESYQNVPGQPRLYNNIITHHRSGVVADKGDVSSLVFIDGVLWFSNDQDTGGNGAVFVNNPVNGDPQYVDMSSGNFHIQPGSEAVDRGVVTTVTVDIDYEPRLGKADLGADEYWAPGVLKRTFLPAVQR